MYTKFRFKMSEFKNTNHHQQEAWRFVKPVVKKVYRQHDLHHLTNPETAQASPNIAALWK